MARESPEESETAERGSDRSGSTSEIRPPTNEEIEKIADGLIAGFPQVLDLFGVKPPKKSLKIPRRKRKRLLLELKDLLSSFVELAKLDAHHTDPREELSKLEKMSALLAPIVGYPKRVYIAEYYVWFFRATINAAAKQSYFAKAGYTEQTDAIRTIVDELYRKNLTAAAGAVLNEFDNSPDGTLIIQPMLAGFRKHTRFLRRPWTRYGMKDPGQLIETYRELSGVYEKLLRIVVGFLKTLEGDTVTYDALSKQPLASNVQFVGKRSPVLVRDFDLVVRNAISHGSYTIHLSNSTIDFVDSRSKITLSFREFLLKSRSLSSVVLAMSQTKLHLGLIDWQRRLEYFRQMQVLAKNYREGVQDSG